MNKEIWIQILSFFPNSDAPANRALVFSQIFKQHGYNVNVITIGKEDKTVQIDGTNVFYVKNDFFFKKKTFINRFLSNLKYLHETKKIIRKHRKNIKNSFYISSSPELIASLAGVKAKKIGAKLIFDVRDIWPEVGIEMGAYSKNSLVAFIFRKIANKLYKTADVISTVSKNKFNYLKKYNYGKYANKIIFVGNGYDLNLASISPDYSLLPINIDYENKFIVSYVGNIGKAQKIANLLDVAACKYSKELEILIAGSGVELNDLIKLSKDKHISNVHFLGPVTKEQAIGLTLKSNLSYIPLASDKMVDSVPTKLYESLGLGTPVLLVANGEAVNILNETCLGLSVLPSQIEKLPFKINEIIDNYNSIKSLSKHSKEIIEQKHSRQHFTEYLVNYLEKHYL